MSLKELFRKKTVTDILDQVAKREATEGHVSLGKHLGSYLLTLWGSYNSLHWSWR